MNLRNFIVAIMAALCFLSDCLIDASRCTSVPGCFCPDFVTIRCPGASIVDISLLKKCLPILYVEIIDLRGRIIPDSFLFDLRESYPALKELDIRLSPCPESLMRDLLLPWPFEIRHYCDLDSVTTTRSTIASTRPNFSSSRRPPIFPITDKDRVYTSAADSDPPTITGETVTSAMITAHTSESDISTLAMRTEGLTVGGYFTTQETIEVTEKKEDIWDDILNSRDFLLRVVLPSSIATTALLSFLAFKVIRCVYKRLIQVCCPKRLLNGSSQTLYQVNYKHKTSDENLSINPVSSSSTQEVVNEGFDSMINQKKEDSNDQTDVKVPIDQDAPAYITHSAETIQTTTPSTFTTTAEVHVDNIGPSNGACGGCDEENLWMWGDNLKPTQPVVRAPKAANPPRTVRFNIADENRKFIPPPPQPNPDDIKMKYRPGHTSEESMEMFGANLKTRVKVLKMGAVARRKYDESVTDV